MIINRIDSEFLRYLLTNGCEPGTRLPSLDEISGEIGISIGKLREQFEVARMLGLVEASPRRGIRCLKYDFRPAVRLSLMVALALDPGAFRSFSTLRIHLETAFWDEAVALLNDEDKAHLPRAGGAGQGQAEQRARPNPLCRTPGVPPGHLLQARKSVRARPAGGLLGRLRGRRIEHLRRLQLSDGSLGVSPAHRGRFDPRGLHGRQGSPDAAHAFDRQTGRGPRDLLQPANNYSNFKE